MRSDVANLFEIMESQRILYSRLLELGREKCVLISQTDSGALDRLVAEERELIHKSEQLEEQRKQLAQAKAGGKYHPVPGQYDSDRPDLSDRDKASLKTLRLDLQHILLELDIVNRTNHKLLENQLKLTRSILGRLTRAHSAIAYGSDGCKSMHMNQSRNLYNQLL